VRLITKHFLEWVIATVEVWALLGNIWVFLSSGATKDRYLAGIFLLMVVMCTASIFVKHSIVEENNKHR
jgi:ACR3 family arsenite efflux pump ArsB